ncbi:MAG: hypothetical protein H6811_04610 [Phycisphaeraceae bacterium]|nr:hypothetical protein [Phycisphaeraceae bacterium]
MTPTISIPEFAQAAPPLALSPWLDVFGRAHPMLVHFPIALLLAGLVFEALFVISGHARRGREALSDQYRNRPPILSPAATACLILAMVVSPVTAWSGWTNAASRSPSDEIELHRWLGIATAVGAGLSGLCALIAVSVRSWSAATAARIVMVISAIVVIPTGHIGGELVFGEGYLLAPLKRPDPAQNTPQVIPESETTQVSFELGALPIFESRCFECHGSRRQRARLRLDSLEAVLANPRAEILSRGDVSESELLRRISLPADDPDRMPPNGDPLTSDEIRVVQTWLASLAADSPAIPDPLPSRDQQSETFLQATDTADPGLEQALVAIRARGGFASPIAFNSPLIEVNFSVAGRAITDADLDLLVPLKDSLVWLNLSGTSVTDRGVSTLAEMSRLTRLNLARTAISDSSMVLAAGLESLEVLNVYETAVTDDGLRAVIEISRLRRLYVWQTQVTPSAVAAARESHPGLSIDTGETLPPQD